MNYRCAWYSVLAGAILILDQTTKYAALICCTQRWQIAPFLSFDVIFNRGYFMEPLSLIYTIWLYWHNGDDGTSYGAYCMACMGEISAA